jgi:glycosyltransferase involved in cell wall biosynthesis
MRIGIFDHGSTGLGGAQVVAMQMAVQLSRGHEVELIHCGEGYSLSSLAKAFEVDLSRVRERVVRNSHESFCNRPDQVSSLAYLRDRLRADRTLTELYDLFIYSGMRVPPFSSARKGLIYCHFPVEGCPGNTLNSAEVFKWKSLLSRWMRLAAHDCLWRYRMSGYQAILANSMFTAHWIKQDWKKEAEVVYPPVSLQVPNAGKCNLIVSIGRFFSSQNLKNHRLQLKAFDKLLDKVGSGWRLTLIGFCTFSPKAVDYLEELRRAAKDMPVNFVVNAERSEVSRHLAEAKLFWHTAGISDDNRTTAPAKMEHFGIAIVEAMLAGCVPLIPANGGQVEIVEHGLSGYHCRNTEDLVEFSVRLSEDQQLLDEMGSRAVNRGRVFNQTMFSQRLAQVVDGCMRGGGGSMDKKTFGSEGLR